MVPARNDDDFFDDPAFASPAGLEPFKDVTSDAGGRAIWSLLIAGPEAASLAFLGTFVEKAAVLAWKEIDARRSAVKELLSSAEEELGSVEEVLRAADETDEKRLLLSTSIRSAANSRYPHSVRAIAKALAAGLLSEDIAKVDTEQQAIEALASIQRSHVEIMWALRAPSDTPVDESGEAWFETPKTWRQLQDELPRIGSALDRHLASLEREGLVVRVADTAIYPSEGGPPLDLRQHPGQYWALTTFGLESLTRLRAVGADELVEEGESRSRLSTRVVNSSGDLPQTPR